MRHIWRFTICAVATNHKDLPTFNDFPTLPSASMSTSLWLGMQFREFINVVKVSISWKSYFMHDIQHCKFHTKVEKIRSIQSFHNSEVRSECFNGHTIKIIII